jgi:quercetin dioxygenase-like cupin family protein
LEEKTMNETLSIATEAVVTPAGQGPFVELGDHRAHVAVSSRDTGGTFGLAVTTVDPEGGVPPHVHTREDETFYILEGRFAALVGGRAIEAGPGDTIFAPRNVPHTWRCVSAAGGKLLVMLTPAANFEAFAIEMAQRASDPQADMSDPAKRAEFMALCERYGITMLPPIK